MIRDPLYRDILQRLSERLDPDAFEHAVPDLMPPFLGQAIPIRGGSDAGFDGAMVDGEGEPYPIVCTTGQNVLGNLQSSLTSNLKSGFPRRRAVLATSQHLSPQTKQKIFKEARKHDFELLGIFDRDPLARLLYNNPEVRRELLGLGGDPPALAAVPAPGGYQARPRLFARDEDLGWLNSTSGDRILAGVPGAGKTALAAALVEAGDALFVRPSASLGAILDACRKLSPPLLVLDDAHVFLARLGDLRTAREDTRIDFAILATTWPGQLSEVADALGVDPKQAARVLELLTRNEILELYRELDVQAPDDFIRELIDQAANRPGLAVTLATLWKQGAWEEIVAGRALNAYVTRTVRQLVGHQTELIAALALGGKAGASLQAASDAIGIPIGEARRFVVALGAAGVISERGSTTLAVEPEQLRSALLAEVFFSGKPDRLDYRPSMKRIGSQTAASEAVMFSLLRGGTLPAAEAQSIVALGGATAWALYASLGREEAVWVLDNYPGTCSEIVRPVLEKAPAAGLDRLLKDATPVPDSLSSSPNHPLRIVRDWIRDFSPNQFDPDLQVRKRDTLTDAIVRYSSAGGHSEVIGPCVGAVLDPTIEAESPDPCAGTTVTFTWGIAPVEVIGHLTRLWDRLRAVIPTIDRPLWSSLRELLWALVQPMVPGGGRVSDGERKATHALAAKIVQDLLPIVGTRPGLARALEEFAAELGLSIKVHDDPTYDILFPKDPVREADHHQWSTAQHEAVTRLAEEWKDESPETSANRLQRLRHESELAGHNWPDNSPTLAAELASRVEAPDAWLEALSRVGLGRPLGAPFLGVIVRTRLFGWEKRLTEALETEDLAAAAVSLGLSGPDLSADLRLEAIRHAAPFAPMVETLALRNEIPPAVLKLLFSEGAPETALAAAIGHWVADPRGTVDSTLKSAWCRVILDTRSRRPGGGRLEGGQSYWLGEILTADPDLALVWLQAEIEGGSPTGFLFLLDSEPVSRAVQGLGLEQRRELLAGARLGGFDNSLVTLLVANDPQCFRALLSRDEPQHIRLAPLGRYPDEGWWTLAAVALEAGIAPEEVALASFHLVTDGWSGSEAEHRRKWLDAFESAPDTGDPGLTEVAKIGKNEATRRVAEATRSERLEAMRSRH